MLQPCGSTGSTTIKRTLNPLKKVVNISISKDIIDISKEQEGQDADDDQQLLLLGRLDGRGDDVESLVRIHDLHHLEAMAKPWHSKGWKEW